MASPSELVLRPILALANRSRRTEKLGALEGHTFALGPPHGPPVAFTVRGGRVAKAAGGASPEVTVRAPLRTFVLIWLGRLDPDAAFFQRRIDISGSLEEALRVKNVLDDLLR